MGSVSNINPLVSIIVASYNSREYIIETLESAKIQTYNNIELIVTDDCSTDDTTLITREWMDKNGARFKRCVLVEHEFNTGIPANVNRGFTVSHGEWIKFIAADDLLQPRCIEFLVDKITSNSSVIICGMKLFSYDSFGVKCYGNKWPVRRKRYVFHKSADFQHNYFLTKCFNFAPGNFIKRTVFEEAQGYDEKYPFIEDLPFWVKITKMGIKLDYIDIPCVQYRTQHESSVFSKTHIYNRRFMDCYFKCHKDEISVEVPWWNVSYRESIAIDKLRYYIAIHWFNNKYCKLYGFIDFILSRMKLDRIYMRIFDFFANSTKLYLR